MYVGSWDPDSEAEYDAWLQSGAATDAQLDACGKMLSSLVNGILLNGPVGMSSRKQVARRNGLPVDLYCWVKLRVLAMCFAVDEQSGEIRLLVIGPFNLSGLLNVAAQRAANW